MIFGDKNDPKDTNNTIKCIKGIDEKLDKI